ncbi:MAG TPA: 16S rRNA (guanine(527)-N(7))-methyltransferase RsmG, partial [Solirubrobacterales bacterium]|nr:16S rRNA (guanine(527)-N(7))-methyltransferase RsmG [Solirubrobacterales bacterium]
MIEAETRAALERYLVELHRARVSVSSVTEPAAAWDVHVLDSLIALELDEVGEAHSIADIGSGGGFPGVALAAALPEAGVDLIESVGRKCEFMRHALAAAGIGNARVIEARAETWAAEPPPAETEGGGSPTDPSAGGGAGACEVVTARAVGPLVTLAELASPLLAEGGVLVAWKGVPDPEDEERAARAAPLLAMQPERVVPVRPFEASRDRHLHLLRKT